MDKYEYLILLLALLVIVCLLVALYQLIQRVLASLEKIEANTAEAKSQGRSMKNLTR